MYEMESVKPVQFQKQATLSSELIRCGGAQGGLLKLQKLKSERAFLSYFR